MQIANSAFQEKLWDVNSKLCDINTQLREINSKEKIMYRIYNSKKIQVVR